jgi:NAD(P)-dependent dehydrogenase (short-subunit alcohol dehydrogenase family)
VTGGGRGIGRGIALELAREGADVAVNYRRDAAAAEETVRDITAMGRRAVAVQADVSDWPQVEAMVAKAVETLGGLHIAVANSGVASRYQTIAELDPKELAPRDRHRLRRRLLHREGGDPPRRQTQGSGALHLVGRRRHGRRRRRPLPRIEGRRERAHASPREGGRLRGRPRELHRSGPRPLRHGQEADRLLRRRPRSDDPLGRAGEPDEIGKAAVFLVSNDASWITGKILRIDGGACM